jgi:hypothetical protein
MPEPDLPRLGSGHIHLEPELVSFVPNRVESWRGVSALSFKYAEVASVIMTEPEGVGRGRLLLRLNSGESFAMSFRPGRLPRMRRTYRDLWHRVETARGQRPSE